jgi:hypothetical protein
VTWTPTARVLDSFVKVFPYVLHFDNIALGSTTPIAFDGPTMETRLADAFRARLLPVRGIHLGTLLGAMVRKGPLASYGPEFDRTLLVDLNRDLFPKDEFAVPYVGRRE